MNLEEIESHTILRAVVGSTCHGLNTEDGIEDRDEMGICVEPIEACIGFSEFEQYIYRSAAEREHQHDARSMAGDLDLTIYSLRKFLRLALKGNPSVINLLFVPNMIVCDLMGLRLRELAPLIISKRAGGAYLGYLTAQKQRLLGERGSLKVHRPELVDAYGYDTKFAMHAVRLGIQGIELMQTGKVTLPMPEPERSKLRDLRSGGSTYNETLQWIGDLEKELSDLYHTSHLPKDPDTDTVEQWMVGTYLGAWA